MTFATCFINLCEDTYSTIMEDKKITKAEMIFLRTLHKVGFDYEETDDNKIVEDIKNIAKYKRIK